MMAAGEPLWDIQKALLALLKTLPEAVYDYVPQGAPYPYRVLGDVTSVPGAEDEETHDAGAQTTTVLIQHFADPVKKGDKQLKLMMSATRAMLHNGELEFEVDSEFEFMGMQHNLSMTQRRETPDGGVLRVGIQRYRITTEEV